MAMDSLLVAAGLAGMAVAGSNDYIALALLLAFMMGALQLGMGMLRLGFWSISFHGPSSMASPAPQPDRGLNQLPHLLGVTSERSNRLPSLLANLGEALPYQPRFIGGRWRCHLGLGGHEAMGTEVPAALVVVVTGILTSWLVGFEAMGIAVVGAIPGPSVFCPPGLDMADAQHLLPTALTLSLVAFMEAISVAKAMEERHDYHVDANQELRALGLANLLGSMFQSYPTTGGFSRTAVTEQAGGKTPVTAWIAATVIGLTLFALTPLFYHLPNAVLAAIVMVAVAEWSTCVTP